MRKWLKRWLLGVEQEPDTFEEVRAVSHMLERSAPAIQAYRIANGFVVHMIDRDAVIRDARPQLPVYCKDHAAIADYLVTRTATEKLLGEQMELPLVGGKVSGTPYIKTTTIV